MKRLFWKEWRELSWMSRGSELLNAPQIAGAAISIRDEPPYHAYKGSEERAEPRMK